MGDILAKHANPHKWDAGKKNGSSLFYGDNWGTSRSAS